MLAFMKEDMPLTPKPSGTVAKILERIKNDSQPSWMREDPYAEHGGYARWWLVEDQGYSVRRPSEVKRGHTKKEGQDRGAQVPGIGSVR